MKSKKYIAISLLSMLLAIAFFSFQKPKTTAFKWYKMEEGFKKAKKEKKILLVDAYTDWCGWCKVMDNNTYTNADIIKLLNEKFVCVKLNPEVSENYILEKDTFTASEMHLWLGKGSNFGYPTTYFWYKPGKSQDRTMTIGYKDPTEFLAVLKEVITNRDNLK